MIRRFLGSVHPAFWQALLVACLCLPLIEIAYNLLTLPNAGPINNPTQYLQRATGLWGFRFLIVTLSVTPLRIHLGWSGLLRYRRTLGLACFGYALIHVMTYFWLDMSFDIGEISFDIRERQFVLLGLAAFILLVPMAITSSNAMIRALGYAKWKRVHQSIYLVAVLVAIHYFMATKLALTTPLIYAGLIVGLLGWRLWAWRRSSN